MIEFISGDILQSSDDYIAQGVATGSQEGLGTGLAKKISQKWPDAQRKFKKHTFNNKFSGGDIFVVLPTLDRPGVIYIATQPDMYHADRTYLNRGIKNLVGYCAKNKIVSVSMPKIGAGLGKLDWLTDVKPLLIERLSESATAFRVYEDFKNIFEAS